MQQGHAAGAAPRFRHWAWWVGTLVGWLALAPAQAVNVTGLYSAEVEVSSQAAGERDAALRSALASVLVKLTGDRNIAVDPVAPTFIAQAERYVQQYRYREEPALTPGVSPKLYLWAAFDSTAVDQFLLDSQLPVWGKNRPLVLVWLAVEQGGQRYLVDASVGAQLKDGVQAAAAKRGLPVVFPLMDLEDQGNIQLSDVWGNFTDAIERASARYRANVIVVGRVHQQSPGEWRGRWSVLEAGRSSAWESRGANATDAVQTGVDGAADFLAKRYAQVLTAGAGEQLRFRVDGVSNFAHYAKVVQYLEGLSAVGHVAVTQVSSDHIDLTLKLRGSRDSFKQVLSLSDILVPGDPSVSTLLGAPANGTDLAAAAPPQETDLLYRLAP